MFAFGGVGRLCFLTVASSILYFKHCQQYTQNKQVAEQKRRLSGRQSKVTIVLVSEQANRTNKKPESKGVVGSGGGSRTVGTCNISACNETERNMRR